MHKYITILHYGFSDMFWFWLNHHQGSTIQGFIYNICVYIYISKCNSCVPPSTRYCNSKTQIGKFNTGPMYTNINN